ncbi:MAG: hypothetical protein ABL961_06940 [Vicinamibacterales bacterium]
MDLKHLLKRGGLLAAANWPAVAIQFVAQTTFQVLLAVPIVGAAVLVAVLLGADLNNLLQGSTRDIFTTVASTLTTHPVALIAFIAAFAIVLVGGTILMFLAKGGTVDIMLAADATAGSIEDEPLTLSAFRTAARFTMARYVEGCGRLFRRYLSLGMTLMLVYAISGVSYLGFIVYGYRWVGDSGFFVGWALIAALSAVALVFWITTVNVTYLLLQIAMAAQDLRTLAAARMVWRFIRAEARALSGVFFVVFGMVLAATFASALAWSGVGLITFVPLVGLLVAPLQIVALLVRGLVFEYIGLTAMGAYVTLYRRHLMAAGAVSVPTSGEAGSSLNPLGAQSTASALE